MKCYECGGDNVQETELKGQAFSYGPQMLTMNVSFKGGQCPDCKELWMDVNRSKEFYRALKESNPDKAPFEYPIDKA